MKDEYAFALEARKFNLGLLKPGAPCKDIFAAYNEFMRSNGRPEEKRLHCHGQGYDLVERPLIRNDEPMNIEMDMNIVVHPTYIARRHAVVVLRQLADRRRTARASGCTTSRRSLPNSADAAHNASLECAGRH